MQSLALSRPNDSTRPTDPEHVARMWRAVACAPLTDAQRYVLVLTAYGEAASSIADLVGAKPHAIDERLRRAVARIHGDRGTTPAVENGNAGIRVRGGRLDALQE